MSNCLDIKNLEVIINDFKSQDLFKQNQNTNQSDNTKNSANISAASNSSVSAFGLSVAELFKQPVIKSKDDKKENTQKEDAQNEETTENQTDELNQSDSSTTGINDLLLSEIPLDEFIITDKAPSILFESVGSINANNNKTTENFSHQHDEVTSIFNATYFLKSSSSSHSFIQTDPNLTGKTQFGFANTQIITNETQSFLSFDVIRSGINKAASVDVSFSSVSAEIGQDVILPFSAPTITLNYDQNTTIQTIKIPIINDTLLESDEIFSIALIGSSSNATIDSTHGQLEIKIIDDENILRLQQPTSFSVSDIVFNEASGQAIFNVDRLGNHISAVNVDFNTQDNTAISGSDYIARAGTLVFNAGEIQKNITINLINDTTLVEDNENFILNLSNPQGASIQNTTANATLIDSKTQFSINDVSLGESNGVAIFSITRQGNRTSAMAIQFETQNNTATANNDFVSAQGTLNFAAGDAEKLVTINIINDAIVENTETFSLILSQPSAGEIIDNLGQATITDDDTNISIANLSVLENNNVAIFSLTRTGLTNGISQFNFTTTDNTAIASNDYVTKAGTLTFASGETEKTITIDILNDTPVENDETFSLVLSNGLGANIINPSATGTIIDNLNEFSINDVSIAESSGSGIFAVTRTGNNTTAMTLDFSTQDKSAIAGQDYTATNGLLTFAVGEKTKNITVVITNDVAVESNENFTISLSNPSTGSIADASGTGLIVDDDTVITTSAITVSENVGSAIFTLSRTGVTNVSSSVDFSTHDDTATNIGNVDYIAKSGTITFASGETQKTISISIQNDTVVESSESFQLSLTNVQGANLASGSDNVNATIIDDDTNISVTDKTFSESESSAIFTLTRTGLTSITSTVSFSTIEGSAKSSSDFTSQAGTLSFASGVTTQTLTITVTNDSLIENNEAFTLTLSNPTNANLSNTAAIATILNDDNSIELSALNGTNGFVIEGIATDNQTGLVVQGGGDFNGDGLSDVIIGAHLANPNSLNDAGEVYVLYGGTQAATVNLSTLNGNNGFVINGIHANDHTGAAVNLSHDINQNGFADILIGAPHTTVNSQTNAGEATLIFGGTSIAQTGQFDLSTLNGTNGFSIQGLNGNDNLGASVSLIGDINGDGINDLLVGAYNIAVSSNANAGTSYIIFGQTGTASSASFDLTTLNGSNGFALTGIDGGDKSSFEVNSAGDFNGDGIGDLMIGAPDAANGNLTTAGESYIVLGSQQIGQNGVVSLSSLNGHNGFIIQGQNAADKAGYALNSAGDINGDGFDDIIIGADGANESYVILGESLPTTTLFDLATLNGSNGFVIQGSTATDKAGIAVAQAGDINGDGFADLLVGASYADPGGRTDAGASYVIFGSASVGLAATFNLSALNGINGFSLNGVSNDDHTGIAVSHAGDFNGDGFDDLIVGANQADPNSISNAGSAYVIFGRDFTGLVSQTGDSNDNSLSGTSSAEILIGGQGNDTLSGLGGLDSLKGGSGNDTLAITTTQFQLMSGGSGRDTLRLDGHDITLDLTNIADNKLTSIENIDITGDGQNTLTLSHSELLNISETGNTLTITGNAGDNVKMIDQVWIDGGSSGGLHTYTSGTATLKVSDALTIAITTPTTSIDLSALNGSDGFILNGVEANDFSGRAVSNAGDINGDGFADLMVGAYLADTSTVTNNGDTYIIFGNSTQTSSALNLSSLNGNNGFIVRGVNTDDQSARSLSDAGDFNGDGITDIIIGMRFATINAMTNVGGAFIVFGDTAIGSGGLLEAANLNGQNGFILNGMSSGDQAGIAISVAGDINGDGFSDVIIGANLADPNGVSNSGEAYIVFGQSSVVSGSLNLSTLNGTNGFFIRGIDQDDNAGFSVHHAGDFNGDGFADFMIGAQEADPNSKIAAGESYLIFGTSIIGNSGTINLNTLDGTTGFVMNGIVDYDRSGRSVSTAGDFNGDGLDDLLIGAYGASPNNNGNAGESYIIFGTTSTLASTFELSTLNGQNGFSIKGIDVSDEMGVSVNHAGDVNGDGFDDMIIGAFRADPGGRTNAGESYVIFGSASVGNSGTLQLSTLQSHEGFTINGIDNDDGSGLSVSSAGDINGDGFDDMIIGSFNADPNNATDAGESYLIFGRDFTGEITQLGSQGDDVLTGNFRQDIIIGSNGNDNIDGGGGADVLKGGSGNDSIAINDNQFQRLDGGLGTDTLKIDGVSLNLTQVADNKIRHFEIFDLTGNQNDTTTLNLNDVLNISDTSNTLTLLGNSGDKINLADGSKWSTGSTVNNITQYTSGQAVLLIDTDISVILL